MNRDQLVKIKKVSMWSLIAGLIITVFSAASYLWADHEIMKLDEGKLDETVLQ